MSRSGTSAKVAAAACSRRSWVCSRTVLRNHCRNFGAASTTPPPRKYADGSVKFAAIVKSFPIARACCPNTARASGSSRSPRPRSILAARSIGSAASGWSGNRFSQYGNRFFLMPVSEAMLSTSPSKPQLHTGTGWSSSSTPCNGICTWPSSPAIPAAPLTTRPASTTPPPSPVPTIAATEERSAAAAPKCWWWAYRAAAFASLW
jgi:hypothetical protein